MTVLKVDTNMCFVFVHCIVRSCFHC